MNLPNKITVFRFLLYTVFMVVFSLAVQISLGCGASCIFCCLHK